MNIHDSLDSAIGIGNRKKATLIITQDTNGPNAVMAGEYGALAKNKSTGAISGMSSALSATSLAMNGLKDIAGVGDHEVREFTVQFNPSSLTLQATKDAMPMKKMVDNIVQDIPNTLSRSKMVILSVPLLFDAVDIRDSFMSDNLTLSADNIASHIVNAVKGTTFSVQKEINGIMALLLSASTRCVQFQWANMMFKGTVNQARSRYTMFNTKGAPVRGIIDLEILQNMRSDDRYWLDAYEKCFKVDGNEVDAVGGKSTGGQLGNLMNLDWL